MKNITIEFIFALVVLSLPLSQIGHAQDWETDGNGNTSTNSKLGTTNDEELHIKTNGGTAIYVGDNANDGGNIGIGTTSPSKLLHVNGAGTFGDGTNYATLSSNGDLNFKAGGVYEVRADEDALNLASDPDHSWYLDDVNDYYKVFDGSSTLIFSVGGVVGNAGDGYVSGDLFVNGATTREGAITVNGDLVPDDFDQYTCGIAGANNWRWSDVFVTGASISSPSDTTLKSDIEDLKYALKEVMQLRPVSYNWIAQPEAGRKIGFIAQEVHPVLPEVVYEGDYKKNEQGKVEFEAASYLGLSYQSFLPVLTNAIQEQQALLKKEEQRTTQLLGRLRQLTKNLEESKANYKQSIYQTLNK